MSNAAQKSSKGKERNESSLLKGSQSQAEPLDERQSSPDSKSVSQGEDAETTKVQNSLKARKRTKTGCLSILSPSRPAILMTNNKQHVENDVSSVERSGRLVLIASNPNEVVKAMLHA